jgi:hypothetical protein
VRWFEVVKKKIAGITTKREETEDNWNLYQTQAKQEMRKSNEFFLFGFFRVKVEQC